MNTEVAVGSALSIVKQITVEAPAERAFRVFTANMGAWWPREHHIGKSALKDCVIEPRVGGRWYEVTEDGESCDWGKVLAWEPPTRLVLAWQLNAQFAYDPSFVTEVEVRFTALGPKRTRVDFEHRDIERFGPMAAKLREEMGGGWAGILASFAKEAAGG
ncbi:MAG TPA: SRPBCC family protein [Polyangiaceae bacterium]|nr:SRPBCC family protein [Polyangiaceae bacterium]